VYEAVDLKLEEKKKKKRGVMSANERILEEGISPLDWHQVSARFWETWSE